LEVCDLEDVDFIQYKPASVFGVQKFFVTRARRERKWFNDRLPKLQRFIQINREFAANPEVLGMLANDREPIRYVMHAMELETSQRVLAPEVDPEYMEYLMCDLDHDDAGDEEVEVDPEYMERMLRIGAGCG
jgi:hypothetical protein